ncbi:MAG: hypothetical protein NTY22_01525, partial [Proteobacteria bacterium]|nr:hypothetical protein [Pseudomonadota bacterium]
VVVEKDLNIETLLKVSGMNISEIQNYNPEFSKKIMEGKVKIKAGSKIKLPPRASYKVEDYFIRSGDKLDIQKRLNSNGGTNVPINS